MRDFLKKKDERLAKVRSTFSEATEQEKMNVIRASWYQFIETCEALDIFPSLFFPDSLVCIEINPHVDVELGLAPFEDY